MHSCIIVALAWIIINFNYKQFQRTGRCECCRRCDKTKNGSEEGCEEERKWDGSSVIEKSRIQTYSNRYQPSITVYIVYTYLYCNKTIWRNWLLVLEGFLIWFQLTVLAKHTIVCICAWVYENVFLCKCLLKAGVFFTFFIANMNYWSLLFKSLQLLYASSIRKKILSMHT